MVDGRLNSASFAWVDAMICDLNLPSSLLTAVGLW